MCMEKGVDVCMEGEMYGGRGGWRERCMEGCMEGGRDGGREGWMEGEMYSGGAECGAVDAPNERGNPRMEPCSSSRTLTVATAVCH